MASESEGTRGDGDQNSPTRADIASICGKANWNHSSGIPRPRSVLDSSRSRVETVSLPELLQQLSNSRGVERADSDRIGGLQRSHLQILSLEQHCRGLFETPTAA